MKKNSTISSYSAYFIFCALFVLFANIHGLGQNLPLSGFSVYANSDIASQKILPGLITNYGVEINGKSKILSGSVGSGFPIRTTGSVEIYGDIHSMNSIQMGWNNIVKGNISAANKNNRYDKNSFHAYLNFSLQGNLDVNGDILINKESSVAGKVTHPVGTIYNGPVPSAGEVKGKPSLPTLPAIPKITNFKPAGSKNITKNQTITPGVYGMIKLNGNNTITFSGPGVYTFSSISNSGDLNKFIFDFENSPGGIFQLHIHGDVNLGQFQGILKNGGSASRIYAETHGDGKTCLLGSYAWTMDNCLKANSDWKGTVYAPYAGINVGSLLGSSTIKGALWSGTKVTVNSGVEIALAAFQSCDPPDANAGDDKNIPCAADTSITLDGSSSTPGVQFSWEAIDSGYIASGANTAAPSVSKAGTYVLTVSVPGGCKSTDTVHVNSSCILPYYPPPEDGKTEELIGSELSSLSENFNGEEDTLQNIYTILTDSVMIDIVSIQGKYNELLSLLQTPEYGLTNIVDNGPNSLIITGKYPVINLEKLNSLPELINYCRPAFPPVSNSGVVNSAGDTSMLSHFARNGFNVNGKGIKLGVISNSFNTIPGDPALINVRNGDLPGPQNPNNPEPVHVLRDYPYGRATDEGRAMLQIVHDIAPGAELAFRTGFISAGDFAEGIRALRDDSCKIIVDDITYITEPFFKDGIVAKAVDEVTADGVSYFTSAGNYGNKSYSGTFKPAAPPAGMNGFAHDFSNGDIYQSISLPTGTYTIVLQWDDSTYSLNPSSGGAKNDLDIYLTDNSGNILFGFNRDNREGDPIEVMPFTVATNSQANILIIKNAGPGNDIGIKYMVFRGEAVINEYNSGTSTIVGQANAQGAMTVGAVLYTNTPPYGVDPPTIASFSSIGGTPVNNVVRQKPDFTGPNGVNTTVFLGGENIDGDRFPNFFGTSAAAPHVAAVAALAMDARQKFYSEPLDPQQVRSLLQNTAIDMNTPGFDNVSGYGFVQPDSAIRSFAAPTPFISDLILPDSTVVPGEQPFVVTVKGNYLSNSSKIYFMGEALETNVISSSLLSATIPPFSGNQAVRVYTPPIAANENDGGYSNSKFFTAAKKNIIVTADDKEKRYGEALPVFTSRVLVDSIPLDSTDYTLQDLGLDSIYYFTPATAFSNTEIYFIRPAIDSLKLSDPADSLLLEQYTYTFNDGLLSVNKLPLTITPQDTSLIYGDKIAGFSYKYDYPDSLIADKDIFLDSLRTGYQRELANEIALADARAIVNGRTLTNDDLENLGFIASARAIVNARPIVNARSIVNLAPPQYDTTLVVDLAVEAIFNYQEDSASAVLVNARPIVNARAIVNARPIVNGTATVNARSIVNGSQIVNGNSVGDSTSSDIAVIIDEEDIDSSGQSIISSYKPLALITGTTTGRFAIVPGAFLTENFDVSYNLSSLNIAPRKLIVKANDATTVYGDIPVFTSTISGYQYEDDSSILAGAPSYTILDAANDPVTDSIIPAGTYTIVPGNLAFTGDTVNYIPDYVNGTLIVKPASLIVKAENKYTYADNKLPEFTSTITGFIGDDAATIISGPEYSLDPAYNGKPGVYSIIPAALKLSIQDNYSITYVPGKLYVNPKLFAKSIKLRVDCIERIPGNPAYKYIVHFSYINNNKTPVFIPAGKDNNIDPFGVYDGSQLELFMPGTGHFDVRVTALAVTWTLRSYNYGIKVTEIAVASILSPECNNFASAARSAESATTEKIPQADKGAIKIYPNPATNWVNIHSDTKVAGREISLFDMAGKKYPVNITNRSNHDIMLSVSHLARGTYIVKIKTGGGFKSFVIIKE